MSSPWHHDFNWNVRAWVKCLLSVPFSGWCFLPGSGQKKCVSPLGIWWHGIRYCWFCFGILIWIIIIIFFIRIIIVNTNIYWYYMYDRSLGEHNFISFSMESSDDDLLAICFLRVKHLTYWVIYFIIIVVANVWDF